MRIQISGKKSCDSIAYIAPSLSKHVQVDEDGDEKDETETEMSSITSYDVVLCISNDPQLFFTQNKEEEEIAGAMFNVKAVLESAKLNHAMMMKQSSILWYFKSFV